MSYYGTIDERSIGDVATMQGWREFTWWAEGLDDANELQNLVAYGWSDELQLLEQELIDNLSSASPDVRSIGEYLRAAIVNGGDVLTVTDGAGVLEE